MKVRLTKDIQNHNPSVLLRAGSVIEVSDPHGYELIVTGYAEHLTQRKTVEAKKETIETAAIKPHTHKRKN
jgi:hypothetical protein